MFSSERGRGERVREAEGEGERECLWCREEHTIDEFHIWDTAEDRVACYLATFDLDCEQDPYFEGRPIQPDSSSRHLAN